MIDEREDPPVVLTTHPIHRLRPFEPGDLDDVVRCFEASVRSIGARFYDSNQVAAWAATALDLEAWRDRFRTGGAFVVEADASIAGFVRVEAGGLVDLLYVHPDHERRGLGRALLVAACRWAQDQGASTVTAEVSLAALALFEVLGFVVLREQAIERRGATLTNYLMTRRSSR